MDIFERQLNKLPKGKLSFKADLSIRSRLMLAGWRKNFSNLGLNPFAPARFRPVLASAIILVLIFSGATSVFAYNSSEVTRASGLYPVKRGLESLEARLATTPAAQVKFHNKLAERRIAEAQFLSETVTAGSTDETAPVKLAHENEFNATLDDADQEISRANQVAGQINDPAELDQSLTLLSDSHLYDLEQIKSIAEDIGIQADDDTTDNIALVLDNIKGYQQRIVRAMSQFNGDLKRAGQNDRMVSSSTESGLQDGHTGTTTSAEAANSLNQVKNEIKDLTDELSQNGRVSPQQIRLLSGRLTKKIDQAKSAIDSGDLNKFNNLLRATEALTNNGRHFLREDKSQNPVAAPKEITPTTTTGEKIKAQFNREGLRQRQEDQRKKLEEQRQREIEKNSEQNRTDTNSTSTPTVISTSTTSSTKVLIEPKTESGSDKIDSNSRNDEEHQASSSEFQRD